ncbi:MAG: 3-deoxy-7-phosphoheptulonate synthase [Candidatus Zixiibacteriota bacterium]|nr:MAG: 3-deoxy-7-phosphoheptulonate synthase [candidate division Zixibacteria bacterium]
MLVVMETSASPEMVRQVCLEIEKMGLTAHAMPGAQRTAIGVTGNKARVDSDRILTLAGVRDIIHVTKPYKLVSREFVPENSVIDVDGIPIGGREFIVIAGPCSVESREQTLAVAQAVAKHGAKILRGGAFKPRTSPYSFQGLGQDGLKILAEARQQTGLRIVTEAIDTDTVEMVADYADIVQIGARNMQNYTLLRKAGRLSKPILLKRGLSATLEELLMAAEYIMSEGNTKVILCERGVRTFADHTRNTLDLSAIPFVKRMSHLPIISDPSHGTGRKDKVLPLSRASIAVGADGIMVEVHNKPEEALSDGAQAITPEDFARLMDDMRKLAPVLERDVP